MRVKIYLSFLSLIICVISIFLVKYTYISIGLSLLSLSLCLIFSRKYFRIFITVIFVSILTIIIDIFILSNRNDSDIFINRNIMIGSWNYGNTDIVYIFNEDYTYFKYDNYNNLNSYCTGNYKYTYGGTSLDGTVITNYDNIYYYDLVLIIDYCVIDNEEVNDFANESFIVGINKSNSDDLRFIDINDNTAVKIIRRQN